MARSTRVLWCAVLSALCALGGSVAASAETSAPAPTPGAGIVYAGTIARVATDSDGVAHQEEPKSVSYTVLCDAGTCTFDQTEGVFYLTSLSWPAGEGSASTHLAGSTTSCSSGMAPDGDLTLTIDATALTAVFTAPTPGWEDCDGTQTYRWAQVITFHGAYQSGETCILTAAGCPVPEPEPEVTAAPIAAPVDVPQPASVGSSFLASGDSAAPSVLSSLATPAEAATAPSQLLAAAILTVILVLLVAFPTALLNSAVEAGTDRFSAWWAGSRRRGHDDDDVRVREPAEGDAADVGAADIEAADVAVAGVAAADVAVAGVAVADVSVAGVAVAEGAGSTERTDAPTEPVSRRNWSEAWWWAAAGVFVAAVISAFVDPEFGFNPGSGRVVLSVLIGFAVDVVLGWSLVILLMHWLVPAATHTYSFRPFTLLVVVGAVLFTRLTGFEPGIVFGLVAGVAFGAVVGAAMQARASLVALGYAFVVALIAWVAYGAIAAEPVDSFWHVFVTETLASIAVAGMAALPIALFPLRGMPGFAVWRWNRWVWAAAYAIGLLAFFVVLMPMPFSWEGVHWNLGAWVGAYLLYAAVAVAAWLALARPWRREDAEESTPSSPDSESALSVAADKVEE